MNAKTAIGRFIRWNREHLGLTQQELAAKANITYQYLSTLESGKKNFTLDVLEEISSAMGLKFPRLIIDSFYLWPIIQLSPVVHRSVFLSPKRALAAAVVFPLGHAIALADDAARLPGGHGLGTHDGTFAPRSSTRQISSA